MEWRELHLSRGQVSCCLGTYKKSNLLSPLETTCRLEVDTQQSPTGTGRTPCGFTAEIRLLHFPSCSLPCHTGFCNSGLPGISSRLTDPTGSISLCIMRSLEHRKRITSLKITTPRPLLGSKQHSRHLSKHP